MRYKRSALGVLWALADPALHVAVYLVTFGAILDADRGVSNYPIFTLMGVLVWLFFSMTLDQAASVILEHSLLIRKIAFPTELLVVSVVASRLTSLLVGLALSLLAAILCQVAGVMDLDWSGLPFLLVGFVLLLPLTVGLALAASALGVIFGDAQFIVRFALRIGFFACPIVYPLTRVPAAARAFYELNPLVGVLWCFRRFADPVATPLSWQSWTAAVGGATVAFAGGWFLFRRLRSTVAELV